MKEKPNNQVNKKFFQKAPPGRRRLKLLIELVLTVIFLIAALVYVHHGNWRVGVRLELQVKFDTRYEDTVQLFINKQEPKKLDINVGNHLQTFCFSLPRKKIKELRLHLGQLSGTIAVKSLTIKNLFSNYQLKGKRLQILFQQKQGISKDYVKNQYYYLEANEPDHWLKPGNTLYQIITRLQQDKISYYLVCVLLSLLVFYFLHFFNPGALGVFLKPKLLVNGVLIFLLVIFIPLADQVFNIFARSHLVEKRKLAAKPEFRLDSLSQYLNQYNLYYNDHFKFRSRLIFLNNLLKVKLFGVSPTTKVLVGKDNWLFFDQPVVRSGTVDYYRSITLLTPQELEQWKNVLEQRHQWLAARGIHYLFVIAPNKNTIYPEFMPDHIRKAQQESRMDQLLEYLQNHSNVPFLDLRQILKNAKNIYPVYSKTDTHWNEFGAYIAYREIIKYISRWIKGAEPFPLNRFKIEIDDHMGGDLAIMLSLHENVMRENIIRLIPHQPLTAKSGKLPRISRFVRQSYTQCKTASLPNIIMVHDSFYHRLRPFLSQQFSRVLYIWDWDLGFYPQVIQHEKPILVIDEMAERFLIGEIPENPENIASGGPGGSFRENRPPGPPAKAFY